MYYKVIGMGSNVGRDKENENVRFSNVPPLKENGLEEQTDLFVNNIIKDNITYEGENSDILSARNKSIHFSSLLKDIDQRTKNYSFETYKKILEKTLDRIISQYGLNAIPRDRFIAEALTKREKEDEVVYQNKEAALNSIESVKRGIKRYMAELPGIMDTDAVQNILDQKIKNIIIKREQINRTELVELLKDLHSNFLAEAPEQGSYIVFQILNSFVLAGKIEKKEINDIVNDVFRAKTNGSNYESYEFERLPSVKISFPSNSSKEIAYALDEKKVPNQGITPKIEKTSNDDYYGVEQVNQDFKFWKIFSNKGKSNS